MRDTNSILIILISKMAKIGYEFEIESVEFIIYHLIIFDDY
jgi:hypothetical protein